MKVCAAGSVLNATSSALTINSLKSSQSGEVMPLECEKERLGQWLSWKMLFFFNIKRFLDNSE